jgi:hypothetical protein
MAKLADAADLKSAGPKGLWGFDSPSRHQPIEGRSVRQGNSGILLQLRSISLQSSFLQLCSNFPVAENHPCRAFGQNIRLLQFPASGGVSCPFNHGLLKRFSLYKSLRLLYNVANIPAPRVGPKLRAMGSDRCPLQRLIQEPRQSMKHSRLWLQKMLGFSLVEPIFTRRWAKELCESPSSIYPR